MSNNNYLNNIFNINSNYNFLPCLVAWILQKYPDPFYLSNITILLPSRRACREIKKCFLAISQSEATILPKILAIGDVDYDLIGLDLATKTNNKLSFFLRLIQEIRSWNNKTNLFGKNISTTSLVEIASNLQIFLDEVEKEGLNLENLLEIEEQDLATHKQKILQFLQYFGSVWQNILIKDGILSIAKNRNLMLKNYNNSLKENGSEYPIIAAGSTGSVLEATKLLKTIANLENGKVVLFGLDKNLDDEIWQKIGENHPQFMLKKLLDRIGALRKNIANIEIEKFQNTDELMLNLCSLAMLPAEFSNKFKVDNNKNALSDKNLFTKIETKNEFEEARIIALIFRKTLEENNKTATLISNNQALIKLVKSNLSAWQIEIDDSKSCNLAESKLANYLFLISEFAGTKFSIVNLLAILKHPFSNCGIDEKSFAKNLQEFEIKITRNVIKFDGFDDVISHIKNNANLLNWFLQIVIIFQPFLDEFKKEQIDLHKIVNLHLNCLNSLLDIDDFRQSNIEGGAEFLEFLTELQNSNTNFELEPASYGRMLHNLLKNYQFRKFGQFHPRLHILSTMEARLMSYDLTIVSGLCEGQFPANASDDWLGGKIRADFGLPSITKKIGVAGYDFCNYLGNKEVILLYPQSQNNAPTIKSRFLLKLETILKLNNHQHCLKDDKEYSQILEHYAFYEQQNIGRTNPQPLLWADHNLTKISATDISKWLRNPYFVYAKRILQLKPLKQIEQPASFAEFGNFVHKVLENFIKDYAKVVPEKRLETLINDYGKKLFDQYFPDKTSFLLWWARFENIAKWFLSREENLRNNLAESFTEIEVETIINNVILTTKIDRLNLFVDGSCEIIDYKTGQLPSLKEIKSGIEPQLAVEALIICLGKIKNYPDFQDKINRENITNLQYQNLKGRDANKTMDLSNIPELINATEDGISRLITMFSDQDFGYVCCPNFDLYKKDDYWHLGRVGEL